MRGNDPRGLYGIFGCFWRLRVQKKPGPPARCVCLEIRNPKAEIRKKPETRGPKPEGRPQSQARSPTLEPKAASGCSLTVPPPGRAPAGKPPPATSLRPCACHQPPLRPLGFRISFGSRISGFGFSPPSHPKSVPVQRIPHPVRARIQCPPRPVPSTGRPPGRP